MKANFYEALLSDCGLSPMLAADVIARVCANEKADPAALSADDLARVLPALEKKLKLYLGPVALKIAVQKLRALARPPTAAAQ